MGAEAGYAAGGMAIFNMFATKKAIQAKNEAAVNAYNATEAALTFTQLSNTFRAAQAVDEIRRVSATNIREAKVQMDQKGSTIAMNEGVTAGNSKARILTNYFLQSSEMMGKAVQQTESAINKLAISAEETNWNLQQKKVEAYQNMKANLVTGSNAALQIISAGVNGAASGYSMGNAMGQSGVFSGGAELNGQFTPYNGSSTWTGPDPFAM